MKRTPYLLQANSGHPLFKEILLTQASGKYVVVDPTSPNTVQYLTPKSYQALQRVSLSNDETLVVLLHPWDIVPVGPDGRPASASVTSTGSAQSPTPSVLDPAVAPARLVPLDARQDIDDQLWSQYMESPGYSVGVTDHGSPGVPTTSTPGSDEPEGSSRGLEGSSKPLRFEGLRTSHLDLFRLKGGARNFSIGGNLRFIPRSDVNPNFLDASIQFLGPVMREWGNTLHLRIFGKVPNSYFLSDLLAMTAFLRRLVTEHGELYILRYLKASAAYLLAFLGGSPLKDNWAFGLGVSLRGGLPTWIPLRIRSALRAGHTPWWRWTISFIYSYKGLMTKPGLAKLASIKSDPWNPPTEHYKLLLQELPGFSKWISKYSPLSDLASLAKPKVSDKSVPDLTDLHAGVGVASYPTLELISSGPNGSPAVAWAGMDALAWTYHGEGPLVNYLTITGQNFLTLAYRLAVCDSLKSTLPTYDEVPTNPKITGRLKFLAARPGGEYHLRQVSSTKLGRLSIKPEGAGKNRVFAIVDYWTQCALKPLHNAIFAILGRLPTDATMDQDGAFARYLQNSGRVQHCFDLSNATDVLPVKLQISILGYFTSPPLAIAWKTLLVGREYSVPKGTDHTSPTIKYTRGQPMGALSSWAMLALTHHYLVYLAASRVGKAGFEGYVICGDDIAISDHAVAKAYSSLCSEIGLPISPTKSVSSFEDDSVKEGLLKGPVVNFISRTVAGGIDITPHSLKDEVSIQSLWGRAQNVIRTLTRGQISTGPNFIYEMVRTALSRSSDVKRVGESFSSGEVSDQLVEFLTPLLFPTPQLSAALGTKVGDVSLWINVLLRRSHTLSRGAKSHDLMTLERDQFPVRALLHELIVIIWRRLANINEVARYNTRQVEAWVATLHSSCAGRALGTYPWGYMSTPYITDFVVRRRTARDQQQFAKLIPKARELVESIYMPRPDDINHAATVLGELLILYEKAPSPVPLTYSRKGRVDFVPTANLGPFLDTYDPDPPRSSGEPVAPLLREYILDSMSPRGSASFMRPLDGLTGRSVERPSGLRKPTDDWIRIIDPQIGAAFPNTASLEPLVEAYWKLRRESRDPDLMPAYPSLAHFGIKHPLVSKSILKGLMGSPKLINSIENPDGLSFLRSAKATEKPVSVSSQTGVVPLANLILEVQMKDLTLTPITPRITVFPHVQNPFGLKAFAKSTYGLTDYGKAFNRTLDILTEVQSLSGTGDGWASKAPSGAPLKVGFHT